MSTRDLPNLNFEEWAGQGSEDHRDGKPRSLGRKLPHSTNIETWGLFTGRSETRFTTLGAESLNNRSVGISPRHRLFSLVDRFINKALAYTHHMVKKVEQLGATLSEVRSDVLNFSFTKWV